MRERTTYVKQIFVVSVHFPPIGMHATNQTADSISIHTFNFALPLFLSPPQHMRFTVHFYTDHTPSSMTITKLSTSKTRGLLSTSTQTAFLYQ